MCEIKKKKLLVKKDKTEAEKSFVRKYQKFSPLIVSDCTMNLLCKEVENVDFDIKFNKENRCLLPKCDDLGIIPDKKILNVFKDAYRRYNNKKSVQLFSVEDKNDDDLMEIYYGIMDGIKEDIREEINELKLIPKENLFYVWELSKSYNNFNWSFAWDIIPEDIIECIPQGKTFVPIRSENGVEYLGENYILKDISKKDEEDFLEYDCSSDILPEDFLDLL